MNEDEAFGVLGLPSSAEWSEIKRAFRTKATGVHPDTGNGDRAQFERLCEARRVLLETEPERDRKRHCCPTCAGDKTLEVRKGWRVVGKISCPECRGTGEIGR